MNRQEALAPALVDAALDLVRRRTGLVFIAPRRSTFESALRLCMRRAGAPDLETYLRRIAGEPELFDDLAAEVTVGETYFLRDAGQWDQLRGRIFPELLERHGGRTLRLWSAGCASGEEPYSMAIALRQIGAGGRAAILGTDLSRVALERARRGEYHGWALRNVGEDVTREYFQRRGSRFELSPSIRRQVEFRRHNLAVVPESGDGYGIGPMDLILCRNVLIYFDADTVARVAARLLDSLGEDGWLVLGASDPLIGHLVRCDVEVTASGLLYRRHRAHRRPNQFDIPLPRQTPIVSAPAPVSPPVPVQPAAIPVPAPAAVAIDRVMEIERAYADRDYIAVEVLARALISSGQSSAAVEVALVRSLANRGELLEAGRACAAALDAHRTSAELAYLHGVLLAQGGLWADSAEALRRALYLDRNLIVAHLALGDALSRIGDAIAARRAFRSAGRLLAELPGDATVPASDGEPAARLAEVARGRLRIFDHSAA